MESSIASKQDIRKIKPEKLQEFLIEAEEKPFRVKQVEEWLWKKSATSFAEMTDLPKKTRSDDQVHVSVARPAFGRRRTDSYRFADDGLCIIPGRVLVGL